MNFGIELMTNLPPEWKNQCIRYQTLKRMLDNIIKEAPSEGEMRDDFFLNFDYEDFFPCCQNELSKVNAFFYDKIAEARITLRLLIAELERYKERIARKSDQTAQTSTVYTQAALNSTAQQLRRDFFELCLLLNHIEKFQEHNRIDFVIILRMHDSLIGNKNGLDWWNEKLETADFYTNYEVNSMLAEVEGIDNTELKSGNRRYVVKRRKLSEMINFSLRVLDGAVVVLLRSINPRLVVSESKIIYFTLGILAGTVILLLFFW